MNTYVTIIDYMLGEGLHTDIEYAGNSEQAAKNAGKAASDTWISYDPNLIVTIQLWENGAHARNLDI